MKQKFIEWFTKNNNGCSPAMEDDRSFVYEMTQHMFEAYQAGVAEGEARCAALAAENAGLKGAIETHKHGFVRCNCCGDELMCHTDDVCRALDETPSTDAFLAEVKREATEPLQKEIEVLKKHLLMSVGDIRDLIDYNAETGVLTAKVNFSGRQAGSVIGSQTWQGYYAFSLFGKKCFAHRLAWLLHYGEWPSQPIDHINGIKTDNSIRNLRLCSLSQNQFNKPTQKITLLGKGRLLEQEISATSPAFSLTVKYSAGHHKDIESAKEEVMKLRESSRENSLTMANSNWLNKFAKECSHELSNRRRNHSGTDSAWSMHDLLCDQHSPPKILASGYRIHTAPPEEA
ncbi:AP2 domain [Enterobacter kobei]|uniref:HNH endonuclease signature motif containing protein n=1 Tax=Enterobacter kobei TaxID=208224 RepID=UPI0007CA71F8|nr:HNH endonuclease signature motif containing protein [Enterobacter kobei]SAZ36591.1 AP2 domain [Enterobacter kobei]